MEQPITIQVFDRELKASVKEISSGCTVDAIRRALAQEKITHGIRWETINDAVERVNSTGQPLANIVIADTGKTEMSVQLGNAGPAFSGEEAQKLRNTLASVGAAIRMDDTTVTLDCGVFIKQDETALSLRISRFQHNVYGEEIQISENEPPLCEPPLYNDRSLDMKKTAEGYRLTAKDAGYLVINESNAWDIIDPFFASSDRLTLYCRIIPLMYGRESFFEKLRRVATSNCNDIIAIITNAANPHLQNIELRRGRPPVAGRNGSITFHISRNPELPDNNLDRMDYRDIGRYREVKEGTLIAEMVPAILPIPGIDVYGEAIPAGKIDEIDFTCGDGIVKECTPGLIRFIARERGVLELTDHYVNVTPQLTINGDVCSETGNIVYSRTVVVNGTVCAGFRVECADLTVRENIEDDAEIICNGQLLVENGIFGERTRVVVSGDAKIGFIQGAYLRVKGNCTIEKYAYHARIFCGGILRVNGKGLSENDKGCMIGGEASSMKSIDLHSAGSAATLTALNCGFDPEGFETFKETVILEKTLKMKIIQLQKRLYVNPNQKVLLLQRIQNVPSEQKDAFKKTLQELRDTIALAEKAGASVALLARKTIAADISGSSILIRNHLIAPVLIVFVNTRRKVDRDAFRVRFSIMKNEIVSYEGHAAIENKGSASVSEKTAVRR